MHCFCCPHLSLILICTNFSWKLLIFPPLISEPKITTSLQKAQQKQQGFLHPPKGFSFFFSLFFFFNFSLSGVERAIKNLLGFRVWGVGGEGENGLDWLVLVLTNFQSPHYTVVFLSQSLPILGHVTSIIISIISPSTVRREVVGVFL